jgi:general nucleoside transport system ATP-binding protein
VPPAGLAEQAPVLEVANLRVHERGRAALDDVSFAIPAGQIVGVAGVSGNGQSELVAALSGTLAPDAGSIRVRGEELAGRGVRAVVAAGVGRIPEDRHASIVGDLSVAENLVLEDLEPYVRRGVLERDRMDRHARDLIERFAIRARPADRVRTLSGGNIQKVLLARVLARDPRVLVVSQPTRGLDVGATEYVREALLARRAAGAAILLVSEDLDELLALSDRLLVLFEGRVIAEVPRADATRERVGLLMAGGAGGAAGARSAA